MYGFCSIDLQEVTHVTMYVCMYELLITAHEMTSST